MKVCGIDLGTTYSSISWYDEENNRVVTVELVNAADGQKIIRSVVYYPQGGSPIVGETAWNAARQHPERVVLGIKRSMGSGDYRFGPVDGASYTPQQISAEILKVLVQEAEAFLGDKVSGVVITVPAHFGDNECAATKEAGGLAGLNVLGLMAEPHAAALAFVTEKAASFQEKDLLVYDLGGGTFDVTLIHARALSHKVKSAADQADKEFPSLEMETLCKDGNASLGGLDWDQELAKLVAEKAQEQHGVDVMADPKNEAFLLDNCEKAKRHLGRTTSCTIVADVAGHSVEVSRQEFEDRTQGLLFQSESLVEKVLEDAVPVFQDRARKNGSMDPSQVDIVFVKSQVDVMLTGGSSKMPMVKEMLKRVSGKDPFMYGNPELLVTIGAAYYAHLLKSGLVTTGQPASPNPNGGQTQPPAPAPSGGGGGGLMIIERTSASYGIEALRLNQTGAVEIDGRRYDATYAVVLPKGSEYGKRMPKEFEKASDNVTEIDIVIYEGKSDTDPLSDCRKVATVTISDLPPGGYKGEIVRVELECVGGMLSGSATDLKSQKVATIQIARPC